MRFSEVLGLLGQILCPFAVLLLAPAVVDLIYGNTAYALVFVGIAVASFVGNDRALQSSFRGRAVISTNPMCRD